LLGLPKNFSRGIKGAFICAVAGIAVSGNAINVVASRTFLVIALPLLSLPFTVWCKDKTPG
jgi:hypothetical protein